MGRLKILNVPITDIMRAKTFYVDEQVKLSKHKKNAYSIIFIDEIESIVPKREESLI